MCYRKLFLFLVLLSMMTVILVTTGFCQEVEKGKIYFSEEEARLLILKYDKNPIKTLQKIEEEKKLFKVKRKKFLEKLNSDSKLANSFIKNPLGTLKQYEMFDEDILSYQLHVSPCWYPLPHCYRFEEVCKFGQLICVDYQAGEEGTIICLRWKPVDIICDLKLVCCDE